VPPPVPIGGDRERRALASESEEEAGAGGGDSDSATRQATPTATAAYVPTPASEGALDEATQGAQEAQPGDKRRRADDGAGLPPALASAQRPSEAFAEVKRKRNPPAVDLNARAGAKTTEQIRDCIRKMLPRLKFLDIGKGHKLCTNDESAMCLLVYSQWTQTAWYAGRATIVRPADALIASPSVLALSTTIVLRRLFDNLSSSGIDGSDFCAALAQLRDELGDERLLFWCYRTTAEILGSRCLYRSSWSGAVRGGTRGGPAKVGRVPVHLRPLAPLLHGAQGADGARRRLRRVPEPPPSGQVLRVATRSVNGVLRSLWCRGSLS
jgi:hypothetical protein